MNLVKEKSKKFLHSISMIKKLAHKHKRSQYFHPGEMMMMKTILANCEENKFDENYYGMKTSELTKVLCITKPATSKMLNTLEEKGYIERTSNKSDRRVVYVKITEEGHKFLKDQNKEFEKFTCKVVEKMGEEDTDNLIHLLDKLYHVIEEIQLEK